MTELLYLYLLTSSGITSTTYGHNEVMCGDVGAPTACVKGAVTASGDTFDPDKATAAIALPANVRIRAQYIYLKMDGGTCQPIKLNDKMNPRYIGVRGFDLTPAAVKKLTGTAATDTWSGIVHVCFDDPRWYFHRTTSLGFPRYEKYSLFSLDLPIFSYTKRNIWPNANGEPRPTYSY